MEILKSLFSKYNKLGRAVRTFLQTLVGLLSFLVGLVAIPGFQDWFLSLNTPVDSATFALWVGLISYLQNLVEDVLANLKKD